jgi:ribose 5-phosphate isomerase A
LTETNPATPAHDRLAESAASGVASGMMVGLGTGRSAARVVRELARRVRDEKLSIDCVCTSSATHKLAAESGLRVFPFADIEEVDLLIDGADEVDTALRMLKGQHGAITRQRLVAEVAQKRIYVATEDKLVSRLGERALLAVTIIPFGIASIRNRLRDLGLIGVVRRNFDGEVFYTDGGGVVLDMRLPAGDPEEWASTLDRVTGVVDHGLFLTEADEVLVEHRSGEVSRRTRP